MTVRRRLETALASAAALLSNLRARLSPAPCDLVGAVLCALAALFLILYAASGFSDAPWFAVAGAAAVLLGCGCALLLRGRRSQRALERWRLARPIVLLLAVPIGFYLLERPWNDQLLAMDPFYAAVNLCVLGALFAIVYAAGQRTRGAVVAFLAATPRRAVANGACALALASCFGWWIGTYDIEEAYACTVDVWGVKESYAEQGSTLCFLKRVQDLSPARPEGYDADAVSDLLRSLSDDSASMPDGAEAPTVIAIMNETFSDLSRYPGLAGTDARPAHYYDIAAEALEAGDAYASALGGGTCNSEFEFLTGSSMGHLGGGVYPYVLYDLDGTESLVSYFSSLGYATHAVHPAESTNWRRDRVYEQLGFDEFADQRAFANADTLRGLTTDRATYDYVLDLLEADEGPQFVFDVTLQNHGGYDVGGLSDELAVSVPLGDGSRSSELDEYASVIRQADRDLAYLVDRLNALDRPVVLCFFGDHQPGFSDWLFEATHDGAAADDLGLEAVQERYTVPYLIWANDAARAQGAHEPQGVAHERTSLNYLGSRLVEAAGLPTTSYQRFLLAMREAVPAINLNGFLTADGIWHGFGNEEAAGVLDALQAYATVQYDNLFNKDSAWAVK